MAVVVPCLFLVLNVVPCLFLVLNVVTCLFQTFGQLKTRKTVWPLLLPVFCKRSVRWKQGRQDGACCYLSFASVQSGGNKEGRMALVVTCLLQAFSQMETRKAGWRLLLPVFSKRLVRWKQGRQDGACCYLSFPSV